MAFLLDVLNSWVQLYARIVLMPIFMSFWAEFHSNLWILPKIMYPTDDRLFSKHIQLLPEREKETETEHRVWMRDRKWVCEIEKSQPYFKEPLTIKIVLYGTSTMIFFLVFKWDFLISCLKISKLQVKKKNKCTESIVNCNWFWMWWNCVVDYLAMG